MPGAVSTLTAKALVIHDQNDKDVRIESGLSVARSWPDARFKRTFGLGHRKILRDEHVIAATVDFLTNRVEFALPPQRDEWSAFPGPAPIYSTGTVVWPEELYPQATTASAVAA